MKTRFYILLTAALIAGAGLMILTPSTSRVAVSNASDAEVISGEVLIAGERLSLAGMKTGEKRILNYETRGDDHYKIKVLFSNGKKLEKALGYVTNGMLFDDRLYLSPSEITLDQTP